MIIPHSHLRAALTGTAAVMVLASCTETTHRPEPTVVAIVGESTTPPVTTTAPPGKMARVAAIEAARSRVELPLEDLTAMSSTITAIVTTWEQDPHAIDLDAQLDEVASDVNAATTAVRTALNADLSSDVAAAARAMDAAADIVATQFDDVVAVADTVALVQRVDAVTEVFVTAINQPGGRADQRGAMDDMIQQLQTVTDDLEVAVAAGTCPQVVQLRTDAVAHMADVADQLGTMAINRQGNDFDTLRDESSADPWAMGTTDLDIVAPVIDCPALESAAGAGPALQAVLEDLTVALNPADLAVDRTQG